jgi:DNA-directed RNA polymerase subunit RPC12/RpoP
MSDEVIACPECDSVRVDVLNPDAINGRAEGKYSCGDCLARFDDPNRRPPKHDGDSRSGLSKELVEWNGD